MRSPTAGSKHIHAITCTISLESSSPRLLLCKKLFSTNSMSMFLIQNPLNGFTNPLNRFANPLNGFTNPLSGSANPLNGSAKARSLVGHYLHALREKYSALIGPRRNAGPGHLISFYAPLRSEPASRALMQLSHQASPCPSPSSFHTG
jgi:hypothetical protein